MEQKNAWIYCRIDAPEDTHGTLKCQYEQLVRYAEQMGFTVVGSSQDLGSGLTMKSTGLSAALEAAKAGAFSFLLITSLACLGRESTGVEPILLCPWLPRHRALFTVRGQRERPEEGVVQ